MWRGSTCNGLLTGQDSGMEATVEHSHDVSLSSSELKPLVGEQPLHDSVQMNIGFMADFLGSILLALPCSRCYQQGKRESKLENQMDPNFMWSPLSRNLNSLICGLSGIELICFTTVLLWLSWD